MANILKPDKTYTDSRGVVYDDAYMIIDDFVGTSIPSPSFRFTLKIFKDEQAKTDLKEPIFGYGFTMEAPMIASYLGTPKDAADQEVPVEFAKKHIYIYLGTEMPNVPTIVWSDWISDVPGGVPQTIQGKL